MVSLEQQFPSPQQENNNKDLDHLPKHEEDYDRDDDE